MAVRGPDPSDPAPTSPRGDAADRAPAVTESDPVGDRLLEAAVEVFAERGYEGARVAEIARRAGLTTGAIYSRYRGKAELLLTAIARRMPDELEAVLAGSTRRTQATEVLAMLGSHLVDPLPSGAGLFLEAVVAGRRDPEIGAAVRRQFEDEELRLAKLVDEAKADGLLDPSISTEAIVRLAHAIGVGMNVTRAIGLEMPDRASWDHVIALVIDAGGVAGSSPAPPAT